MKVLRQAKRALGALACGWCFAGCASVGVDANKQGVLVRTEPPGAEIWVDGLPVARAPAHVEISRSFRPEIQLKTAEGLRTERLPRRYRWSRSFLGNLIYFIGAPAGWAIDVATGAAWDAQDPQPYPVGLSRTDTDAARARDERFAKRPVRVAIAPPFSEFAELSDLAGEELERKIAASYPEYSVVPYRKTLPMFIQSGYDIDEAPADQRLIWSKLQARYVFESSIESRGDSLIVKGIRRDPLTGESSEAVETKIQAVDDWAKGYSSRRWWARLAPNSLGLIFANQDLQVSAGGRTYNLKAESPDAWWEQGLRYMSALELTNVPLRRPGRALRAAFAFVPAVRVSKISVRATGLPGFDGTTQQTYHRLRVGGGYGGEAGVQMGRHYLYLNLIPLLFWSQLTWAPPVGADRSITNTGIQLQAEAGYALFATSKWHLRLFTRSQSEDVSSWQEALGDRLPPSERAGFGVQEVSAGLAVAYRFEPTFDRDRAQKLAP